MHKVDFLLIAGDVYDTSRASLRGQMVLRQQLQRLEKASIPVYIVHGNHDPIDKAEAGIRWPDNVYRFGAEAVEEVSVVRGGQEIARIHGISYKERDVSRDLSAEFVPSAQAPYSIALLHCSVDGLGGRENYAPTTLQSLVDRGFQYWALGHVHKSQVLYHDEDCCVVYPGSPQGLSSAEVGARSCFLVKVDETGATQLEMVPTADVVWETVNFDIKGMDDKEALITSVDRQIDALADRYSGASVLVEVHLTGRGPLHSWLSRPALAEELLEIWQDRPLDFAGKFVFPHRVLVDTRRDLELEKLRQGRDFLADLIQIAEEYESGTQERVLQSLSSLFDHRRGKRYIDRLSPQALSRLVEEAKLLALDLILGEEG